MHELGMCEAIVDAVLRRAGERRVTRMRVRIGGHPVDEEVVRQAIQVAAMGTVAEAATVELRLDPMRVRCAACGNDAPVLDHMAMVACPRCGGLDVHVEGEDHVLLESISVETTGDAEQWTPSSC